MAHAYPIHKAKAQLSELLRQVKRGRSVTISERGTAIARVVPIQPDRNLQSRLEELERGGMVTPADGPSGAIRTLVRRPGALKRFLASRA